MMSLLFFQPGVSAVNPTTNALTCLFNCKTATPSDKTDGPVNDDWKDKKDREESTLKNPVTCVDNPGHLRVIFSEQNKSRYYRKDFS